MILIIALLFLQNVYATQLMLTIRTEEYYDIGESETVTIEGNLTLGGVPVSGLVSIQIKDPKNDTYVLRTLMTGTPSSFWPVEILEATPCDSGGNPKSSFSRGSEFGFKITIRNNCGSELKVIVPLNIIYSNGIALMTFVIYDKVMDASMNETVTMWPILEIPNDAPLGIATVYASALIKWPQDGGFAYCPERPATFSIISGGGSNLGSGNRFSAGPRSSASTALGVFNLSFGISAYGGWLGYYRIYAIAHSDFLRYAGTQETFEAVLIADITGPGGVPDGKVSMQDVYLVILAFGSEPGDPDWNPIADIVPDKKINMADIYKSILDFGKYGQL
jgi:hypothetical protein